MRKILTVLVAALLAGGLWAAWPRCPDLAAFDADRMAEADAALWRTYYDKRYLALFAELYAVDRDEFGFSPLDSLRLALAAAEAASAFQPTKSRAEAQAARPALARFFTLLGKGTRAGFDPETAADRELDWWQARRETIGPEDYGLRIALVSSLLYGFESPLLREAGVARAQAMAYCDEHRAHKTDDDWKVITDKLRTSCRDLRAAIDAAK